MAYKLANGKDSTLGNWRDMSAVLFGEESPATKYLDQKITETPFGRKKEVWTSEEDFLRILRQLAVGGLPLEACVPKPL